MELLLTDISIFTNMMIFQFREYDKVLIISFRTIDKDRIFIFIIQK